MIGTLTIEEAAVEATKLPTDFGYYGELDLGVTWGFSGFSTHRDADAMTTANWQSITEDLCKRFPDDTSIMGASHWAVGWTDELLIRVYDEDGDITHVFHEVLEYHHALADYPVIDESLMSRIEHEELIDYLKEAIPFSRVKDNVDLSTNVVEELVAGFLFEHYTVCHVDEVTDDQIEDAMNTITLIFYPVCRECDEQDETGYIALDGSGRCAQCDVAAEVEAGDACSIVHDTYETNPYQVFTPNGGAALVSHEDAYDFLKAEAEEHDWRHLNFYSVDSDGNVMDLNEIGYDIDYANQTTFEI